ncbi:hypothetical protein, partial [Deinococcus alpinitundrae]|uniref:hypothetical protein n=1 Tax=Deinococcus alpinitundrae TaxID=468913 RepID=UPI001ED8EF6E
KAVQHEFPLRSHPHSEVQSRAGQLFRKPQHLSHRTRPTITVEQVQREGWLSSKEAAQRLGITWRMFMRRVQDHGLTPHRVSGVPGRMIRYDPAEVRSIPVPVAPRGKPRGFVTLDYLADACGTSPSLPRKWIQSGLPHVRDRVAFHAAYVRPAEALAWLEGQANPKRRRYTEALRLHLEQQRAA